jgi:hypothetical protein
MHTWDTKKQHGIRIHVTFGIRIAPGLRSGELLEVAYCNTSHCKVLQDMRIWSGRDDSLLALHSLRVFFLFRHVQPKVIQFALL